VRLGRSPPERQVVDPLSPTRQRAALLERYVASGAANPEVDARIRVALLEWEASLPVTLTSTVQVDFVACYRRGCVLRLLYDSSEVVGLVAAELERSDVFASWPGEKLQLPVEEHHGQTSSLWILDAAE
jgi:hypothetical protein